MENFKIKLKDLMCFLRIHLYETLKYETEHKYGVQIIKEFCKCRHCNKEKINTYKK